MDHDNLWEITVIPSVSFKTVSLSSRTTFSARTINITSEQSKQNFCLPLENEAEVEDVREATEKSKIMSPSLDHSKSNCNDSLRFRHSGKESISELSKDREELNDQRDEETSTGNTRAGICGDTNNAIEPTFIELGAVCKILDFITDSNPNVTPLTNSCCNEIPRILRCLLARCRDKTLEDFLSNDPSLYRCERCGVISYMLRSHPAAEEIQGSRRKQISRDADVITADRVNYNRSSEECAISTSPSDMENIARLKVLVSDCRIDRRVECKQIGGNELNETESLPIKERAFVMKNHAEDINRTESISYAEADASIKIINESHLNNNAIRRECQLTNVETLRSQMRREYNGATQNNYRSDDECLIPIKAYADIEQEEIARRISYEPKSQIDDLLAGIWYSKSSRKTRGSQQSFEKHGDMYAVSDTVKYLTRGPFAVSSKGENELLSRLQDGRCARLHANTRKGTSSVLYGSRYDYPRGDSGFWLFDESGRLPEALDEYRHSPISRLDNRENIRFAANISPGSNAAGKIGKSGSWSDCLEKDSLEDCARLQQQGAESDTATFSSSSAENSIREWMGSVDTRDETNNIENDVSRGRRLVSSRPSLNIARHVKAEIARDTCSDNARKSMPQMRNSNIVAQLSRETRRKIYYLLQKITSDSTKDPALHREECLTTDILNGEKLLHSKSVDARFVRSDNQITNICADNHVPTRLSNSSEDNHSLQRSADSADVCSQGLNKSRNSIQIPHENTITPVSPDNKSETRRIARRIIYKDTSPGDVVNKNDEYAETLSIYREILENSGDLEWSSFQELVEDLHPDQREVWLTVCKTISEEAKRERAGDNAGDGEIEVCIEISPVSHQETAKTSMITTREIVFEMDMTLNDVEGTSRSCKPHNADEQAS